MRDEAVSEGCHGLTSFPPGGLRWHPSQRSRPDALPSEQDFVFLDGPPYANGDLHMGLSSFHLTLPTIERLI